MSEHLETLGQRLAHLRERRGWTQKELGLKAQLSPTFLSEVENDKRNVSTEVLLRLADCLRASLDFLVRGQAVPPEREPISIPAELAAAAAELGWSYDETARTQQAASIVIARRRPSSAGQASAADWAKEDWIDFHGRLFREGDR